MYKSLLVSFLTIFSIVSYQNLHAHNASYDNAELEAERKAVEKQQASDNWDDFMKAIKDQEIENTSEMKFNDNSSNE